MARVVRAPKVVVNPPAALGPTRAQTDIQRIQVSLRVLGIPGFNRIFRQVRSRSLNSSTRWAPLNPRLYLATALGNFPHRTAPEQASPKKGRTASDGCRRWPAQTCGTARQPLGMGNAVAHRRRRGATWAGWTGDSVAVRRGRGRPGGYLGLCCAGQPSGLCLEARDS